MTLSTGEPTVAVDALWLAQAVRSRENVLLEHKQQWYDLSSNPGKAEFVKDILAMANTVRPDADGYILIGVEDKRGGGGAVGVENPPGDETLQQILGSYTSPVPAIEHSQGTYEGKTLSIIKVRWTPSQPYYATRDMANILQSANAYVRNGSIIGTLSLPALDALIRQKHARLGLAEAHRPIIAGFVEEPALAGGSKLVARVLNRSTEPVTGVSTIWDLSLTRNPVYKVRRQGLVNAPFQPGEAREVDIDLREITFQVDGQSVDRDRYAWASHLDVVLHVKYRDEEGMIQEFNVNLTIAGF